MTYGTDGTPQCITFDLLYYQVKLDLAASSQSGPQQRTRSSSLSRVSCLCGDQPTVDCRSPGRLNCLIFWGTLFTNGGQYSPVNSVRGDINVRGNIIHGGTVFAVQQLEVWLCFYDQQVSLWFQFVQNKHQVKTRQCLIIPTVT